MRADRPSQPTTWADILSLDQVAEWCWCIAGLFTGGRSKVRSRAASAGGASSVLRWEIEGRLLDEVRGLQDDR